MKQESRKVVPGVHREVDQTLLVEWKGGDERAFELLVRMYMKRAYHTALGLVGNREDALDLSQEAFVRAHKARARFDPQYDFYPWFYKILRNLCYRFLKKRKRRAEIGLEEMMEIGREPVDGRPDPGSLSERKSEADVIRRALSRLKPEFREILILKHFEDLSYKEIAEAVEIPIGTVMSRLYHARRALRQALEEWEDQQEGREQGVDLQSI